MMTKPLCIVIGVGPGNGASFAKRFSREAYHVAILARNATYLDSLAKSIPDCDAFPCDVRKPDELRKTLTEVADRLGPASVMIYNAGAGEWQSPEETTLEGFVSSWQTNALGLLVSAQAMFQDMNAQGRGNIVVIGATASIRGGATSTAFASAKAAQRSLAQSLARRFSPKGIHVSHIIIDGIIDLPRTREKRPDAPDDFYLQPDDIADTVATITQQPRSAWTFEVDLRPHTENW